MSLPHDSLSDAVLVERCRVRPPDHEAWSLLVRRHDGSVRSGIRRNLGGRQRHGYLVEAIAADVWEYLFCHGQVLRGYDPQRPLGLFLGGVAYNRARVFVRDEKRRQARQAPCIPDDLDEQLALTCLDALELAEFVATLTPRLREFFHLQTECIKQTGAQELGAPNRWKLAERLRVELREHLYGEKSQRAPSKRRRSQLSRHRSGRSAFQRAVSCAPVA